MDVKKLIEEYLAEARLLQVATMVNDQPWVCTVYFAHDPQLNLYWLSKPNRRHSKELAKNPHAAGAIVLPHTPGDKVRGLQLQGTVEEITEPAKLHREFKHYGERFKTMDELPKIISGENKHHLYKLKPTLIVLFDEVNFPDQPRQEFTPTQ